jgi:energy-coupling factor transporter ATP-binding protein EcfA2
MSRPVYENVTKAPMDPLASATRGGPVRIAGNNFSGRSELLCATLRDTRSAGNGFFLGPYAESGLSGIATTVAEELAFYGAGADVRSVPAFPRPFSASTAQRVSTLSGGEQTLLALRCFEFSGCSVLGIDSALEHLDPTNRRITLEYLLSLASKGRRCILVDNRWPDEMGALPTTLLTTENKPFPLRLDMLAAACPKRVAPTIEVDDLKFFFVPRIPVLAGVSFAIHGGQAYRLYGANGSGKSTFLKLLTGVLSPVADCLYLDGKPYTPRTGGNEVIALATQDPDHQWVATTIEMDLQLRLKAFKGRRYASVAQELEPASRIACFGISDHRQRHVLDLPKALRKRLSWLWPLAGTLPWIAFDEPTIGQDWNAVQELASAVRAFVTLGFGVLFVSHDDRFADLVPHKTLYFRDHTISLEDTGPRSC